MNEFSPADHEPPRLQAWLALACAVLACLSYVYMDLFVRGAPEEVYLLVAGLQGLLIFGAVVFGIWALGKRGHGGVSLVVPAWMGLLLSAGAILLRVVSIIVRVFQ
jgi:drug/metabolite transporter (DMT)-like permease